MWNILAKLFGGGVSTVVDSAGGLVKTIWGDKAAKDAAVATEQMAILQQYAGEFVARQQRTAWDSFVDGLNRLVRPGLALGAQAAFVWAAWDPVTFSETMQALALVPEYMWLIWFSIFAFYFGGRILENLPKSWKIEPRALDLAREIAAERKARRQAEAAERAAATPERQPTPIAAPLEKTAEEVEEPAGELHVPARDNAADAERAVAATIWGEARGESYEGKLAVGCVIRNRVESPGWWGRDWTSVSARRSGSSPAGGTARDRGCAPSTRATRATASASPLPAR